MKPAQEKLVAFTLRLSQSWTCVGGGVAAQTAALSSGGKKAIIKMAGKSLAKKMIPGVGWASVTMCVGKAVGDEIQGSSSGGSGGD